MQSPVEQEQEQFVLMESNSSSSTDVDNASNDRGVGPQRLECGCPRYQHHLPDTKSVVAGMSLCHTVVQDPNNVLTSLPKFRKCAEQRLFLLDVWLKRQALYYTPELINAYIDAFNPVKLEAGQTLIKEHDTITRCYVVYEGQLRQLKDHRAPCTHKYQISSLDCGAEIFYDSVMFQRTSPFSYVAVEDSLLFSLGLKDLASFTAAMNELRRGAFLDCLRDIQYLRPLSVKELHALAESWNEPMKTFDYEVGYQLQEQGAVPTHLYYIVSGGVELTDGRVSVRRGPGDTVCAQALLHLPSPYRAVVVELSTLISLDAHLCTASLRERFAGEPDSIARLAEELQTELAREACATVAESSVEFDSVEASVVSDAAVAAATAAFDASPTPAIAPDAAPAPATVPAAASTAAPADAPAAMQRTSKQVNLKALHRRAVLILCRTPQLRGLLRPTELEGLLSDAVQKTTQILVRQKNECLYASGIDYAKYVYIVTKGKLRETAPDGPDGSHALVRMVSMNSCVCTESLLLLSACLCPRSAYANTACTVVSLDVDAMEETIGRTFISVMKRRPETFRQCVSEQFFVPAATGNELAFRDEVFPRDVGSSDFHLKSREDGLPFKALAVLRLVVAELQLLMEPLGDVLGADELRSLRHCHRAVVLGGGRNGGQFSTGETVVTEEESRRRILYFVQSGAAVVVHVRGSRPAPDGDERPETRAAGSLLCPEQLYLPAVCCYEARATTDGTRVALVNQHVLETAMGCEFRDIFLRQPEVFRAFLAARYPGAAEAELQLLLDSQVSQDRRAGRVYAFGLEALLCHQQLGRLFTDEELQRLRAAPSGVMPCILEKQPNQSIFLEGADNIANIFVVYKGKVTTTVTPGPNRPKQLLETHVPGDLLGTESLFRAGLRSTSAYATCATELIVVAVDQLEATVGVAMAEVLARDTETMRAVFHQVFQSGKPMPSCGWLPGVDPHLLLAEDEDGLPAESRQRGRHLRVEAQIVRDADLAAPSGGRSSLYDKLAQSL